MRNVMSTCEKRYLDVWIYVCIYESNVNGSTTDAIDAKIIYWKKNRTPQKNKKEQNAETSLVPVGITNRDQRVSLFFRVLGFRVFWGGGGLTKCFFFGGFEINRCRVAVSGAASCRVVSCQWYYH